MAVEEVNINRKQFSRMVESFMWTHKGVSYIEAICEICERNEIDVRDSKRLLTRQIVEKLEVEACELNLLIGGNTSYTLDV
jgi:hypothetical protein